MKNLLTALFLLIPFVVLGQGKTDSTKLSENYGISDYRPFDIIDIYMGNGIFRSYKTRNNMLIVDYEVNKEYRTFFSISSPDSNHIVTIKLSPSLLKKVNDSTYQFKQR